MLYPFKVQGKFGNLESQKNSDLLWVGRGDLDNSKYDQVFHKDCGLYLEKNMLMLNHMNVFQICSFVLHKLDLKSIYPQKENRLLYTYRIFPKNAYFICLVC